MLIPVTFKNNDTETVKTKVGKVSTQTARMLYANTFSDKVGIVKGYKKDDSTEELSIIGATPVGDEMMLTFNKGAVSIYGGIGIIEQGTTVNVPQNITDYSFGIVVNLGNQAGNEMKFYCKPSGELRQDDLQINDVDGVYEFELFKITTTTSTASTNSKTNKYIYSVKYSLDDMKNYIEKRLNSLGFKQGSIDISSIGATEPLVVTKQGNYCILSTGITDSGSIGIKKITINSDVVRRVSDGVTIDIGTLPEEFRPKNYVYGNSYMGKLVYILETTTYNIEFPYSCSIIINPKGQISLVFNSHISCEIINLVLNNVKNPCLMFVIGYESNIL